MSVIQFPGKYVYKPGIVKGIDLQFQNNTGRKINDLLIYVFPTSSLVNTPDITKATVKSKDRKIIDVSNMDKDGDAEKDLDEIKIENINPLIGENDFFEIVIDFEVEFDGDEGIAMIATWNGRAIGSTDHSVAAEDIPDGPSIFDLVIDLAKIFPLQTFIGSSELYQSDSYLMMLANSAANNERFSQRALLELASIIRSDQLAHEIVLNAAKTRQQKIRRRLTVSAITEETSS